MDQFLNGSHHREQMRAFSRFRPQFFKNAANSDSPLTPFSPESEHARGGDQRVQGGAHRQAMVPDNCGTPGPS